MPAGTQLIEWTHFVPQAYHIHGEVEPRYDYQLEAANGTQSVYVMTQQEALSLVGGIVMYARVDAKGTAYKETRNHGRRVIIDDAKQNVLDALLRGDPSRSTIVRLSLIHI